MKKVKLRKKGYHKSIIKPLTIRISSYKHIKILIIGFTLTVKYKVIYVLIGKKKERVLVQPDNSNVDLYINEEYKVPDVLDQDPREEITLCIKYQYTYLS